MEFGLPDLPFADPEWVFVVLVAAAMLGPVLARLARLPSIIVLVVLGMLVGPHVLGLLDRPGMVEVVGGAGLLYLMFLGGLELDLDAALGKRRRDTLVFGAATFLFPLVIGIVALLWVGFEPLAAILLASCWSSHTLVTYPVFQQRGLVDNPGVSTAVGATLVTNLAALFVLAGVVGAHQGQGAGQWLVLIAGSVGLVALTVGAIPALARWFFDHLGEDRLLQVMFVLLVLFAASAISAVVGIEPLVGAFLAGLGLNRHVPKGGYLVDRLRFLGDGLLVPVFLLSVGMLIDPRSLWAGTAVVGLAALFSVQTLGGKGIAAVVAGRLLGRSRQEWAAMYSLTAAEAAATLAAVFVGLQVGLFEQEVVDAVVVVILVTCLVATVLADRVAGRLPDPADEAERGIGENVVVAVADPQRAASVIKMAALLAGREGGLVRPLHVMPTSTNPDELRARRAHVDELSEVALRNAAETEVVVRAHDDVEEAIEQVAVEVDATAVMVGWPDDDRSAAALRSLRERLAVPVLVCRPGNDEQVGRLLAPVQRLAAEDREVLGMALGIAARMARHAAVPLMVRGAEHDDLLEEAAPDGWREELEIEPWDSSVELADACAEGDVVVLGLRADAPLDSGEVAELVEALADRTVLGVYAPDPKGRKPTDGLTSGVTRV